MTALVRVAALYGAALLGVVVVAGALRLREARSARRRASRGGWWAEVADAEAAGLVKVVRVANGWVAWDVNPDADEPDVDPEAGSCPCHSGLEPWPSCSCGYTHDPTEPVDDRCEPLWSEPWGCLACSPTGSACPRCGRPLRP